MAEGETVEVLETVTAAALAPTWPVALAAVGVELDAADDDTAAAAALTLALADEADAAEAE